MFDSNVFGKTVMPKADLVQRWAEACSEHDAQLWIPEVVVWELAQRMLDSHMDIRRAVGEHNQRLIKAGLATTDVPDEMSEADVREALEHAGGVVVDTEPDAAVLAIRDQVLQRGAASRKEGIKTGAADSAWVRSVLAHNGGNADGLIFVTGDRTAVTATCAAVGVETPLIAEDIHRLRSLLGPPCDASADQVALITSVVVRTFGSAGTSDLMIAADLDRRYQWWDASELELWEHQESTISVRQAPSVDTVVFDVWSSSLTGRVHIPVLVEESFARQDYWGEAPEYLYQSYDGWIDGDLTVYIPFVLLDEAVQLTALAVSELEDIELRIDKETEELDRQH